MIICTQDKTTPSQPALFVGYSSPVYNDEGTVIAGARLSVHRVYNHLKNKWGGLGRSKSLDHDGKLFNTLDEARKFALDHGYVRYWFRDYSPTKKEQRRQIYLMQQHNKLVDTQQVS
jgi:hypothetical protein